MKSAKFLDHTDLPIELHDDLERDGQIGLQKISYTPTIFTGCELKKFSL